MTKLDACWSDEIGEKWSCWFPTFSGRRLAAYFWKAVRKRECAPDDASEGLSLLEDQEVQTIPSYSLIAPALEIAMQHDRSVYDCIYIALAKVSRSEFITADERLANAVAAYLPVKWLGAI